MTKPAIKSVELWVIIPSLIINTTEHIMANPDFITLMGDKMFIVETVVLVLLGVLRTLKTSKKVEGWFKSPEAEVKPTVITKSESRNISAAETLERELKKTNVDNF